MEGAPPCPITREGTAVSFAGTDRDEIYLVGSVFHRSGMRVASPSVFSSEGAVHLARPEESTGPTLAAPGELGGFLGGILASGVLTGSKARLSGTSMAAPAVARRLMDYFRTTPPASRSPDAEEAALVGADNWASTADPRTGHGLLKTA
jgi:hypothetical protein